MKVAAFLERDGLLNNPEEFGTVRGRTVNLERFRVNEAAREALWALKREGLLVIATTNQPGICQGRLAREELEAMHRLLLRTLPVDDVFFCPHPEDDGCLCFKPAPGLMLEAAFKWHIDLERSFVISDTWQDARAAHRIGAASIVIQSPRNGDEHRDFLLPDLETAAAKVLELHSSAPALFEQA